MKCNYWRKRKKYSRNTSDKEGSMKREVVGVAAAAVFLAVLFLPGLVRAEGRDWDLVLLITSDTEGQLEPLDIKIKDQDGYIEQQVGGFARLAWAVDRARQSYPGKVLLLSGGEDLMGPFFTRFHGEPVYRAMNRMGYGAAALGNHEFDQGDAFLAQSLALCDFPILESNIHVAADDPLSGVFADTALLTVGGLRVGVFGLMNEDLSLVSKPGKGVAVDKDYPAVARAMAESLRARGADVIVALAHMGFPLSRELALAVPDIDLVCVGGEDDIVERGRELVRHEDGRITVVVQVGQKGMYLGMLKLDIEEGEDRIKEYHWSTIRLEESLPEDEEIKALVAGFADKLPTDETVVRSLLHIDTSKRTLRTGEAPLGSLCCDIIRERFGVDVAVYNGGGIRGDVILPPGDVTSTDLETMFPFGNTIALLTMTGEDIRLALERGVSALPETEGQFLQVSGLRYEVDLSRKPMVLALNEDGKATGVEFAGERVTRVEVQGSGGAWEPLSGSGKYTVATNMFLAQGGDGFFMFQRSSLKNTDLTARDVVRQGLEEMGEIAPAVSGRIRIQD